MNQNKSLRNFNLITVLKNKAVNRVENHMIKLKHQRNFQMNKHSLVKRKSRSQSHQEAWEHKNRNKSRIQVLVRMIDKLLLICPNMTLTI